MLYSFLMSSAILRSITATCKQNAVPTDIENAGNLRPYIILNTTLMTLPGFNLLLAIKVYCIVPKVCDHQCLKFEVNAIYGYS